MRKTTQFIAKIAASAVLTASLIAPARALAAEPVTDASFTNVEPWSVVVLSKEGAGRKLEAYKVDKNVAAWTELEADGKNRTLYAFDGSGLRTLAVMPVSDWKDDGNGFYDAVRGNFDVADGMVVWTMSDGLDREIYAYDGDAVKKVSENTYDDRHPVASKGRVAWTSAPGSSYNLMVKDRYGIRRLDSYHVLNYAFSGENLYWLNKLPGENWFRVFVNVGLATAPVGEGDDRPLPQYFLVDGKGTAAWEYSTKRWDYDKRIVYLSHNGAPAARMIQRDVPPNITRVEDIDGGRVMMNVTDLLYTKITERITLLDISGPYGVAAVFRKEAQTKVRFTDDGYVRQREPNANIGLVVRSATREDFLTLEPVIKDRFDADGPTAAGARVGGGIVAYTDGKSMVIPSTVEATDVAVKNGDIVWTEGADGARTLKFATKNVLVKTAAGAKRVSGRLVKASGSPTVYLAAADGRRYVFPAEGPFLSWYKDFSTVRTVSPQTLSAMPVGGNVLYRPGSRLLKSASSPKVYAVGKEGTIHWIAGEDVVSLVFGQYWKTKIDVVTDPILSDYATGSPITAENRYYATVAGL